MADWKDKEKQLIKGEESCVLHPYKDSLGFWTIGWGHHDSTIGADTPAWSQEHADQVFDEDFEDAETTARRLVASFDSLSGARKGVVTAMSFQLGEATMKKFVGTIQAIDDEDWAGAAMHMRQSLWAKQTPLRVRRLAKRMETDSYE